MANREDRMENRIKEGLYREAEDIREEIEKTGEGEIPEELKEELWLRLQEKIDAYEEERPYAGLSEKDREALRLGREIQDGKKEEDTPVRRIPGKRRWRTYAVLAAALVLVLAIGMTSMGGAERIASVIGQLVGERKIMQVDSDKENMVMESEDEQKAYERIKDSFGVDPVKIIKRQEHWKFMQMNLDENLQIAELIYKYGKTNFVYMVNAGYYESSLGVDVEDEIIKKDKFEIEGNTIDITVYRVKATDEERCMAHFTYNKLEYFLIGAVSEEQLKKVLNNLYFF